MGSHQEIPVITHKNVNTHVLSTPSNKKSIKVMNMSGCHNFISKESVYYGSPLVQKQDINYNG